MVPPAHVCKELARVAPDLRLCWIGQELDAKQEEEGCFGIVRLQPTRYLAENAEHIMEPIYPNEIERPGPIFSKTGRPDDYDWNRQSFTPLLIFTCTPDWGLTTADVFGTRLVEVVRESRMTPQEFRAKRRKTAETMGIEHAYRISQLTGGMAEQIHWGQKQSGADRFTMARKHLAEHKAEKARRLGRRRRRSQGGVREMYLRRQGF